MMPRTRQAVVQVEGGAYVVRAPYDAGFVAELKQAIPAFARAWDGANKAWRVAAGHDATLLKLLRRYYEVESLPPTQPQAGSFECDVEVRYLGRCKRRGTGEAMAAGWWQGAWGVYFPESVLRVWFGIPAMGTALDDSSYYALLGLAKDVDAQAIRSAYRRMARQWHPDVCKEPDAHERFIQIQRAYEVLSSASSRARYDAGLAIASVTQAPQVKDETLYGFRPPLRCGVIKARFHLDLHLVAETILAWADIVNMQGQTLVPSWDISEGLVERWV